LSALWKNTNRSWKTYSSPRSPSSCPGNHDFSFKEDLARAVAAERKRTNVEQQLLKAMQKTIDGLQSEMEFAVLRAKDAL